MAPWPYISEDEQQAALAVLASGRINYWTGHQGKQFEQELVAQLPLSMALTVANGTLALEAALRALGVGVGDEVIVTPRSYFASTGAVVAVGARPRFADVDLLSQNLTANSIERVCTENTKAILLVHLAGWPCEMGEIMAFANAKNLKVIEDCAQAHGAMWQGQSVGGFGHAAAFSFCQNKIITSGGEGGALITNREDVYEKAWSMRENGKNRQAVHETSDSIEFAYIRHSVGSNWRLSEVQSAIGRKQLSKLDMWLKQRRQNATFFNNALVDCPGVRLALPPDSVSHAYYQFYFFIESSQLRTAWSRDLIIRELRTLGIPAHSGACAEIYREPVMREMGFEPANRLESAQILGDTSVVLPVYPTLTPNQLGSIAERVVHIMRVATRRSTVK